MTPVRARAGGCGARSFALDKEWERADKSTRTRSHVRHSRAKSGTAVAKTLTPTPEVSGSPGLGPVSTDAAPTIAAMRSIAVL